MLLHCCLIFFHVPQRDNFWSATSLFELLKSNLANNLKTNWCGSFVLLFSVSMNIISMLIFGQYFPSLAFYSCSAKTSLGFMMEKVSCLNKMKSYPSCSWYNLVVSNMHFHYYNDLVKLNWLKVILLCWCKRNSICLISFCSLYEFIPVFIGVSNTFIFVRFLIIFLLSPLLHHLLGVAWLVNHLHLYLHLNIHHDFSGLFKSFTSFLSFTKFIVLRCIYL